MEKDSYIKRLRRQKKRFRRTALVSPLLGLMIGEILLAIVRRGPTLGIPDGASQYMLKTLFYDFSRAQLRQILMAEIGSDVLLPLLLAIYWGHHLCFVVLFGAVPFVVSRFHRRFRSNRYKNGLLDVDTLLKTIESYMENPSAPNRLKLGWTARTSRFHYYICPIRRKWYKSPEFQWISTEDVAKSAWGTIAALTEFKEAVLSVIRNDVDLRTLLQPLGLLQEYYISVARRADPCLRSEASDSDDSPEHERAILKTFAKKARPLIIAAARSSEEEDKPSQILSWLARTYESPLVKTAAAISVVAGIVMIVGVVLFKIPSHQAFTTWFSVSFGSLSLSVGISSFTHTKDDPQGQ